MTQWFAHGALDHYDLPYDESCQMSGWVGFVTASWPRIYEPHHQDHIEEWFR